MPHHTFIDIGANLTDSMYQGIYGGKHYHEPDLDAVLDRAWAAGVTRIIITAGNLADAQHALRLAQTNGSAPACTFAALVVSRPTSNISPTDHIPI